MPTSLEIRAILFAGIALAAFSGGAWTAHKIDAGRYTALELAISQAHDKALQAAIDEQKRADDISRAAADQDAAVQRNLTDLKQTTIIGVSRHVQTVAGNCVSVGLIRVLNAAASGQPAADMPPPGGKPDAACSSVNAVALARSVVGNYFTALANAQQLNALIDNLKAIHKDGVK